MEAPEESGFVRIYDARSTLEAELIRKVLSAHEVPVLIPGDDLDSPGEAGLAAESIFVPIALRDRALALLQEAWNFFTPPDGVDRG